MCSFENILLLVADSPDRLRACDLDRVLEHAENRGELIPFTDWIIKARGDLTLRVLTAFRELVEERGAQ